MYLANSHDLTKTPQEKQNHCEKLCFLANTEYDENKSEQYDLSFHDWRLVDPKSRWSISGKISRNVPRTLKDFKAKVIVYSVYSEVYLQYIAGWWFGTFFIFHILGISSSQLTFIFFRGVAQPPTSIETVLSHPFLDSGCRKLRGHRIPGAWLLRPWAVSWRNEKR